MQLHATLGMFCPCAPRQFQIPIYLQYIDVMNKYMCAWFLSETTELTMSPNPDTAQAHPYTETTQSVAHKVTHMVD